MSVTITRTNTVQLWRTLTTGKTPAPNSLLEGELVLGLAAPQTLWAGVPTSIDPLGYVVVADASKPGEAPQDGAIYGRRGTDKSWQSVLPLAGGIMGGPLDLFRDPQSALEAVTKRYADTTFAPIAGGGYVQKTGDVMSGQLTIQSSASPVLAIDRHRQRVASAVVNTTQTNTAAGYLQAARNGCAALDGRVRRHAGGEPRH